MKSLCDIPIDSVQFLFYWPATIHTSADSKIDFFLQINQSECQFLKHVIFGNHVYLHFYLSACIIFLEVDVKLPNWGKVGHITWDSELTRSVLFEIKEWGIPSIRSSVRPPCNELLLQKDPSFVIDNCVFVIGQTAHRKGIESHLTIAQLKYLQCISDQLTFGKGVHQDFGSFKNSFLITGLTKGRYF